MIKVPTVLILDENGRVLKRAEGYMNAQELYYFLHAEPNNKVNRLVGDEEIVVFPLATAARYIVILLAKLALQLLS